VRGRRVARASGAPSRDALREILRDVPSAPSTARPPTPDDGHTHDERGALGAQTNELEPR
jgi:hypothetical protein